MSNKNRISVNEVLPFLDQLCVHTLVPRYGEPVHDGFTIKDAYNLLQSKNIHYSIKTVERRLTELVEAGILQTFMAGRQRAYRKNNEKS